MLSIIVCSVKKKLRDNITTNISNSIGAENFELIVWDNSHLNLPIAKVYNKGIEKAKYPYLLFVHEDVVFHTKNWGTILINEFKRSDEIGLVGIAGTKLKTKSPTAWWETRPQHWVMNLIQHYNENNMEKIYRGFTVDSEEVVCLDGVFIGMRRDDNISFDERLGGFHNYDQAISLRFREKGYKVMVNGEILIEHFSAGNKNIAWLQSNFDFYELYKHLLPQSITNKRITREETAYSYYRLMLNFRGTGKQAKVLFYFAKAVYYHPFNKTYYRQFYKMLKDILKNSEHFG